MGDEKITILNTGSTASVACHAYGAVGWSTYSVEGLMNPKMMLVRWVALFQTLKRLWAEMGVRATNSINVSGNLVLRTLLVRVQND